MVMFKIACCYSNDFSKAPTCLIKVKIGKNNSRVIGLDGDMKNSTFSEKLRNVLPNQHIECFICEQNMAGVSSVFL
jgi:transketolase C-terminal domain/subunit